MSDISSDNPTQQIQLFIESMENYDGSRNASHVRTTYESSVAVQNVENAMNFTYGFAGTKYTDYDLFLDTITVSKVGTELTEAELAVLYDEVLDRICCHFEDVSFTTKHVKLVDLVLISQNASSINVGMIDVVGDVAAMPGPPSSWNFVSGEDWYGIYGTCNNPFSGINGSASEIGKHVSYNNGPWVGQDWYYTEIETVWFKWDLPNQWDPISWTGDNNDPFSHFCIDSNEGNTYVSSFGGLFTSHGLYLNKDFLHTTMDWEGIGGEYFWYDNTKYGIRSYYEERKPIDPEPNCCPEN